MNFANQASSKSAVAESAATQAMRSEGHKALPAHSRNAAAKIMPSPFAPASPTACSAQPMPRAPMPRPTAWPRAALAALFMAFALTTLAPDNAAAQTAVPDTLDFGTITLSNGVVVNLNLIAPVTTGTGDTVYTFTHVDGTGEKVVTVTGGKTYYFLDAGGGGTAEAGQIGQGGDSFAVADMKLFFADSVTDISDTQDGNHDGGLDERSYTIGGGSTGGGSTLVLPTVAEWEVLRASAGGVPEGWLGTSNRYASSSPGRPGGAADNYNYQLGHSEAVDGPGTSPYSDNEGLTRLLVAVQVIAPTAPAAPTGVTATQGNMESLVTWEPVPEADNGGSAVLSYTATAIDNEDNNNFFICTAGADADNCTITGLVSGVTYSIVVVATNSVDDSLESTAVTATPGTPGIPTVTLAATSMQIVVSWTASTYYGATPVTGYEIVSFISNENEPNERDRNDVTISDSAVTTYTLTGLTNGERYRVVVQARNAQGTSKFSPSMYATPSTISLANPGNQTYTVGQTVAVTLPEATGGTPPYVYSLPGQVFTRFGLDGLTFTASERTITGTPTTPTTEARPITYRVVANDGSTEAYFTITIVAAAALSFTETVAERTYPIDQSKGRQDGVPTPIHVLPAAEGGIGTLSYTLNPANLNVFGTGALRFNAGSRTISSGSPTQRVSEVFTYTVHDGTTPTPQTASLTFKISTVNIFGDGTAVRDVDGMALAVDDVGTTDHNLRLFMPADHTATTFRVTTYTPDLATPPDGGYIFSGVAMDIDLRPGSADSIPTGTEATVCLSTTGVQPSYAPALFLGTTGGLHVQGAPDGWVSIGSEIRTRGGDRYVCGETSEFAPYFAVASKTTGPAIILTPPTRTLAEGSTTTYTVALATMPTVDVTVTITGHAGTDVTPDMTTLTFTTGATGTWGTAQTVTLTAREDADAVDDDVTLTHTASGGDYGGGSVTAITADFTATVTENDAVGLTLTPGALTFAEGGTATYTVTLNSQPTTDVALTIASSNTDATPDPNTLSFNAGNWNTPRTVILTDAEPDGDADDDTAILTHTASGGEYGSVTGTLTFTVTDDDAPGLILTPDALTTLAEGTTATYTVRLNTVPTATVTVTIADATTHVTPTPAALTFNTGDWNTAQTVTITAVQDDDAVNESVTLTHTAAGGDYASLSGNLAVNIEDDETRGLTLTPDALTFDEGGTATYTAVLDSEPSATVTVNIIGDNPDVTPTPAVLTFTTSDWRTVQTVTLTDNELDDTDAMNDMVTLMHTASGGDYGGGGITAITAALTFTVTDDDIAFDGTIGTQTLNIHQAFSLTLPKATGVGEGAVTYTLTRVGSGDRLPPGLSFDGVARTISGVPTSVFGSAQLRYDAIDIALPAKTGSLGFLFFVVDERGISLSRTNVTLTEEDTDTYTVTLATQPTTDVMVTIDSGSTTDVTTNPTSLSFTTGNWDRAQTVTIMAVDDADMTTDSVMLTHTARGGDYTPALSTAATTASNLTVTVIDNDAPNLTLTPNTLMLNEGGSSDTHEVALTITSSAAVTVNIVSDNNDVTPTPDALTFAADDSSPQTVTLTALEDDDTMRDSATLTYTASGGASGTYNGVFGTVMVSVNDNDDPPMFSATTDIADRIYPFFTPNVTIPTLTLPAANGGSGTLAYALAGAPAGLSFDAATLTLSGAPTAAASASLIYTVTDGGSMLEDSLTFSVSVVTVGGTNHVGTAVADVDGTALAVNNVGTMNHNLRLFLPDEHIVNTVTVKTYTLDPATPPDGGYIFSGVAMDIDLRPASATSIPANMKATVCLSTTGVQTSYAPALFLGTTGGVHVQGVPDGWVSIGSEIRTRGGDEYVCGETDKFAPYFAVASMPAATTPPGTTSSITLSATTLTLAEGSTATYTVVLNSKPSAPVTVTIASDNTYVGTMPDSLTFAIADWGTPQTVTLTAAGDTDTTNDNATLTHTAAGGDYDRVTASLGVTISDTDTPPTFGDMPFDSIPCFDDQTCTIVLSKNVSLTLPTATGGVGTLSYTLAPLPTGLTLDATTGVLSGTPDVVDTQVLTYTVADGATPAPQTASLTFNVMVVMEQKFVPDNPLTPIVLTPPSVTSDSDTAVTVWVTPPAANTVRVGVPLNVPDAPSGIEFTSTVVDITLVTPLATDGTEFATVCLPTTGVPGGRVPLLYHYYDTTWREIGDDIATREGFVCGETANFSPFAVGSRAASEELNEQILSRASQAMTASVSARVAARVEAAAGSGGINSAGDPSALAYQFGGQSSMRDLLQAHGKAMLEGEMDYERLLDGASFVLPLSAAGDEGGGKLGGLSLWGGADFSNLDGDTDNLDWDGEIVSFHLGVDAPVGNKMLAGLALSLNTASFDFTHEGRNGDYDYTTTNLHPYLGYIHNEKLNFWGAAGFGEGEIEIEADGGAEKTDADYLSLAGGFSTHLRDLPGLLPDSVISLNVKGDASVVQVDVDAADGINAQEVSSNHIRLLLAGEHRRELAGGGLLAPSMEVGVRYDGGDGETGSGVEIGTGLRYAHGKLTLNGNVRGLLLEDYDEWGADFTVRLAPQSGRGLSLSLQPVWGQTQSTAERLWDDGAGELGGSDTALQSRMDSEVGYGLATTMLGSTGVLTPYAGMTTSDGGVSHLRLGGRFAGGDGLSLNLEGARGNGDDASHTVLLRGELAF